MQPTRLTPLIFAAFGCLLVMGAGAYYFITTPSQNIQLIIFGTIILLAVIAIFYFNWRLSQHKVKTSPQRRLSLTAQSDLEQQVRILQVDLDSLTEIVKDLAVMVEEQQKHVETLRFNTSPQKTEIKQEADIRQEAPIIPDDTSFFLSPIVTLSNKSTAFYEAIVSKADKKDVNYVWKINNGLHLLSKLKAKSPELKMLIAYPFQNLGDKALISALMLHRSMLPSLVIDIEGIETLDLSPLLIDQMRILNRIGVRFALSNVGSLLQSSRLKSISQFKEAGVVMVRHSVAKIDQESFVKGDIDRLNKAQIALVVDNIDDNTNLSALIALGVKFGQGPTLGAARPIKGDLLVNSPATSKISVFVTPDLRKSA